jgi:hypothetical protein
LEISRKEERRTGITSRNLLVLDIFGCLPVLDIFRKKERRYYTPLILGVLALQYPPNISSSSEMKESRDSTIPGEPPKNYHVRRE